MEPVQAGDGLRQHLLALDEREPDPGPQRGIDVRAGVRDRDRRVRGSRAAWHLARATPKGCGATPYARSSSAANVSLGGG